MSEAISHPISGLLPADVAGFESLVELALDMRWTWNHATDEVWRQLDPVLWDLTHHPCDVLQTVSPEKIRRALADPAFCRKIDALVQSKRQAAAPAWFQLQHPAARPATDYTARLIPHHEGVAVPLEDAYILWQR